MNGDHVVRDLFARNDTPTTAPAPAGPVGYLGLRWQAAYDSSTRRWEARGIASGAEVTGYRIAVSRVLDETSQEEVARVVASLLGSITEDEGSLMAESLMQEGNQP